MSRARGKMPRKAVFFSVGFAVLILAPCLWALGDSWSSSQVHSTVRVIVPQGYTGPIWLCEGGSGDGPSQVYVPNTRFKILPPRGSYKALFTQEGKSQVAKFPERESNEHGVWATQVWEDGCALYFSGTESAAKLSTNDLQPPR